MKRITFRAFAVGLTFILGVAAVMLYIGYLKSNSQKSEPLPKIASPEAEVEPAETPFLEFCELVDDPEKYHERIVRFRAIMRIGIENTWFSDAQCGADNAAIVSTHSEAVDKAVEKARSGKKGELWAITLDMTVTGKFKNIPATECCTKAPFQFEILSVERASKIE